MQSILISLGHNSSAVGINNGKMIGYEEERIDRKKSSSAFPYNAIERVMKSFNPYDDDKHVFISHWFDSLDEKLINSSNKEIKHCRYADNILKHYDGDYIADLAKQGFTIHTNTIDMTHHDAHAYSALWFFNSTINKYQENLYAKSTRDYVFVCDGFGNAREAISIYKIEKYGLTKVSTAYGYNRSLGLLYQYATAYTGMKENEDEYKFLGYESHITEVLNARELELVRDMAFKKAGDMFNVIHDDIEALCKGYDEPYIDLDNLLVARKNFYADFDEMFSELNAIDLDSKFDLDIASDFDKRVIIGHYIQTIVEQYLSMLIDFYRPTTLLVAGGLFYNVKLNNSIARKVYSKSYDRESDMEHGLFSVMPIAGDQGAHFGMFYKFYLDVRNHSISNYPIPQLNDFLLGKRDKDWSSKDEFKLVVNEYVKEAIKREGSGWEKELADAIYGKVSTSYGVDSTVNICSGLLADDRIPQVVRGDMEYGPRALCNTSSILNPTADNVEIINTANGRNTVMPMAPIILEDNCNQVFHTNNEGSLSKKGIVGSLAYMIVTLDYDKNLHPVKDPKAIKFYKNAYSYSNYSGVMHKYPIEEAYSGRPQLIRKNQWVYDVLKIAEAKRQYALINTSYNVHGRPIVFTYKDAIDDFIYQINKIVNSDLPGADKRRYIDKLYLIIEYWD